MKKLILPIACFSMLMFAACGNDDENGNRPNGSDERTIVQQGIVPTVLTVTVEGTVNGVEQTEFSYGTIGLLYCTERNNADDLFQEWLSTGNLPDSSVKMGGRTKKESNGIVSTTIEGLDPNTSYSACLFFKPSTGKKRIISKTFTFKTGTFDVQAITENVSNVCYYSVTLNGQIKGLDPADRKACNLGFVVSEEEDPTVGSGRTIEIDNASESVLSTTLRGILPSKQYNYRIFIQPVGHDDYTYGNNIAFRSKSADDMAIDLGLSVEWSRLLLGAEEEGQRGNFYLWGDVNPAAANSPIIIEKDNRYLSKVYYDNVITNNRPDFSISGTEYDAATYALGEGWRTPTKAEFEELLSNCKIDAEMDPNATIHENSTVNFADGSKVVVPIIHLSYDNLLTLQANGKVIRIPTSDIADVITKQDGSGIGLKKSSGNVANAYFLTSDVHTSTDKNTGVQTVVGPCYYVTNEGWLYAPELFAVTSKEEWSLIPLGLSTLAAYPILPVRDKK